MLNDAPIIQKIYDFYREFHLAVPQMPKHDRHSIGERINNRTLDFLENIIHASRIDRKNKFGYLDEAASQLDLLKILVRLAEDTKAISPKKYLFLSEKLQEIGKMLGGWIRSLN